MRPKEQKAILYYVTTYDLVPQLSTRWDIYFRNREGQEVSVPLATIVSEYEQYGKNKKREAERRK